jgi:carbonic anhydrase/acetyltransferase-like protein (isoleucine patch superfamily)
MKHQIRDGLTLLCLIALVAVGGFMTYWLSPWIRAGCGELSPVALVVAFCLITGLTGLGYLRLLNGIFPLKPGCYEMADAQCSLWKHHVVIRETSERFLRPFFPLFLRAALFRLTGVRMGRDATVAAHGIIPDPLLTEMGAHAVVGENACVTGHALTANKLTLGPVHIGESATVGINAVVMPGARIGAHAVVAAGAVVVPGTNIPAYEMWGGAPARRIKAMARVMAERSVQERAEAPVGNAVAERLEAT